MFPLLTLFPADATHFLRLVHLVTGARPVYLARYFCTCGLYFLFKVRLHSAEFLPLPPNRPQDAIFHPSWQAGQTPAPRGRSGPY